MEVTGCDGLSTGQVDNVQVEMEMIKMALDMKEAGCGEWLDNRKIAHLLLLPCSSKPTMMHFKITCAAGWHCTHYISSRNNHNADQDKLGSIDAAMLYWCRRGVSVSAGSWPSLMTPQSQPCPAQTFFGHQHIFCGSLGWKFIQVSNMNKKEASHLIILCWWIDISCTGDMADSIILNNIDLNLTEYCYSDFMVKPWTLWSPFEWLRRSPSIRPALSPANPCPTRMEHASSRLVQALNARGELGKVGRTTLQGYLASEQSALNSFWNHTTSHCVNLICMLPIASNCVLLCETFGLKKVSDPYENGMVGVSPSSPSVWRHTYQQLMPHPRHLQTFKWYSPFSHSAFCISSTCPPASSHLSFIHLL